MKRTLLLASKSPRRIEILQNLGIDATVLAIETDETVDAGLLPRETVLTLASRKAQAAYEVCKSELTPQTVIVAADTVVAYDNQIFGKPQDADDAFRMLTTLSGRTHEVYTGIAVVAKDGRIFADCSESRVTFRSLTDDEIRSYIATGEPMDKAGAYGIQLRGALLAEKIEGDFFGIMGLSPAVLHRLLKTHCDWDIFTEAG